MSFLSIFVALSASLGAVWSFMGSGFDVPNAALVLTGESVKEEVVVATLPDSLNREEVVEIIGNALGYDVQTRLYLHDTYRIMQWDAFKDVLIPYIAETRNVSEEDREILVTHNAIYLDVKNDLLESLYIPGDYTFSSHETVSEVAELLIVRVQATNTKEFIVSNITEEEVDVIIRYIERSKELLPDLVPLPPQDVGIRNENGKILLVFTTIYYNQGKGGLELRADPKTLNTPGDIERFVNQRIEKLDGTVREKPAGTFEWHTKHVHYHFVDFVEYTLERIDGGDTVIRNNFSQKSTFCIRDISKIKQNGEYTTNVAKYLICGRERQGISVGWGDAYFQTYADQNFDISGLPSGKYRLSFNVNPADRFDEMTKENNYASAEIEYNADEQTVKVLNTTPETFPEFEHIYTEQTY